MLVRFAFGLPISIGLFLVACRAPTTPHEPRPLAEVFSFVAPDKVTPKNLISSIKTGLDNHEPNPNKHALGLRALLHFNPHSWMRTGLRANRAPTANTQFLNFGKDGFLLATLEPNGALETLSLYAQRQISTPPEFRGKTNSAESNLSKSGFASFLPDAQQIAINPVLGRETTCMPLGTHKPQETFLIAPQNHSGCVFSRTPKDLRFPTEHFESTLACFNTTNRTFWNTRLDKTQFVFPVSETELLAYEGGYTPPKVTRINLQTGEQVEQPRDQQGLLDTQKQFVAPIPDEFFGVYECSQSTARITPDDIFTTSEKSFYFIDHSVFEGTREPRPTNEAIWYVNINSDNLLSTHKLSWGQANSLLPGFNTYPAPICSTKAIVDIKCALATLQMAADLAFENLGQKNLGTLRAQKSLLAFTLLNQMQQKMGLWLLDFETWKFLQLFASDAVELSKTTNLPSTELQAAEAFLDSTEPVFETKNPEARRALRSHLNVPEAFWEALTSPPQ